MFLENLFPPIPSELIMPLAGFAATQGTLELPYVILAGVVGTVLGALPWYYASQLLGEDALKLLADKYGRWLAISSRDIAKAVGWFDRHDTKAVLLCRLVPGVRTLISIPAGISKMPMGEFLLYSTLGTLLWTVFLTYSGYLLGSNYHRVETYLGPVSKLVLISLVIGFMFWVAMRQLRRRSL
jgi:membrane protein DedA with SNARE-associated domain